MKYQQSPEKMSPISREFFGTPNKHRRYVQSVAFSYTALFITFFDTSNIRRSVTQSDTGSVVVY